MAQNYLDPTSVVQALAKPQGVQVAGDVVPMNFAGPNSYDNQDYIHTGPTPLSAPYVWGQKQDPKIAPIPIDVVQQFLNRMINK